MRAVPSRSQPGANAVDPSASTSTSGSTLDPLGINGHPFTLSSSSNPYDPFHLASSLLPHPSNMLLSLGGAGPTAALITGSTVSKKKPGMRPQPGLPPSHFSVTSGQYNQFGKSLSGLSGLRGDEIDGDLGEVRRKRVRTGGVNRRR